MYRSLRFQLIASVLVTVAIGLGASQWLGTRLSERALEEDLRDRTLLVVDTVSSMWEHADSGKLRQQLATLVGGQRPITAIDIFLLRGGRWEITETTRSGAEIPIPMFRADRANEWRAHEAVSVPLRGGGLGWRMALPLRSADRVVGAVQVEVRPGAFARLKRSLRLLDVFFLVGAVALISLVLAVLLERRVARPVTVLVEGMRHVEDGDLGARVPVPQGGEFGFLARSFNSMVSRIEELTTGLEARVESATRDLATKNQQLSAVNERLLEAQLEVARAERLAAHGQMAATIAHELGTPLNSVLGYAQLLLRDESVPERVEKLSIIESQVQRMAETIRGVLERVRDKAFDCEPVEVEPLVTASLALVSPQIGSRNLVVRTEIEPHLPPLLGDAGALRQALINLLTNAIDATAPSGTITVAAAIPTDDASPGPFLEIAVCDTGAGMTPEQLQKAGEPFYTTKAPGRGTGLGLVIVDHIIRAHRGWLVVESVPGRGTTARVRLPLES